LAALERKVLEYLALYSPKKWDTLYIHFAIDRQTTIQPVLHALKDARYVEVSEDADQLVGITASGLKRLEKQDFLRGSA
jgi:DNA-binding PadR family transcriptional regulator